MIATSCSMLDSMAMGTTLPLLLAYPAPAQSGAEVWGISLGLLLGGFLCGYLFGRRRSKDGCNDKVSGSALGQRGLVGLKGLWRLWSLDLLRYPEYVMDFLGVHLDHLPTKRWSHEQLAQSTIPGDRTSHHGCGHMHCLAPGEAQATQWLKLYRSWRNSRVGRLVESKGPCDDTET